MSRRILIFTLVEAVLAAALLWLLSGKLGLPLGAGITLGIVGAGTIAGAAAALLCMRIRGEVDPGRDLTSDEGIAPRTREGAGPLELSGPAPDPPSIRITFADEMTPAIESAIAGLEREEPPAA
jgi:hypothetical protein